MKSAAELIESTPTHIETMRRLAYEYITSFPDGIPRRESGIYFVVDYECEEILYVGSAVDIAARWSGHKLKYLLKQESVVLHWKNWEYRNFASKEHEEAFWITLMRPTLNIAVPRCTIR